MKMWLNVGRVTDALKALRDQELTKVMIICAIDMNIKPMIQRDSDFLQFIDRQLERSKENSAWENSLKKCWMD